MVRPAQASRGGSRRGRDALVIVLDLGPARAATRAGRFGLDLVMAHLGNRTDRWRQEIGDARTDRLGRHLLALLLVTRTTLGTLAARTFLTRAVVTRTILARLTLFTRLTLFAGTVVTRTVITRAIIAGTILTWAIVTVAITALVAFAARLTILTVLPFGPLLAFLTRLVERILVALAVEAFVLALVVIVLVGTLILEARAGLAQHTEIMIRELQVIFGLHTVTRELRIAGHVLVLLEQLRGIATAALFAATAAPAASPETSRLLTPTTATAAALAIVHQA